VIGYCRLKITTLDEDNPRLRHSQAVVTVPSSRGDATHPLESLHQRRRKLGEPVSLAQLRILVSASRVDTPIPAEGEAVFRSGCHAPYLKPSHGGHRGWLQIKAVRIAVACHRRLAARQQPSRCVDEQTVPPSSRSARRLPAAALPRAPGQVRHPRLGAAGGTRARDKLRSRRAVTTGDLVGGSAVSCSLSPWRKRLQVAATRTRSRTSSCWHTSAKPRVEDPAERSRLAREPAMAEGAKFSLVVSIHRRYKKH
jgi:hypothetical protein